MEPMDDNRRQAGRGADPNDRPRPRPRPRTSSGKATNQKSGSGGQRRNATSAAHGEGARAKPSRKGRSSGPGEPSSTRPPGKARKRPGKPRRPRSTPGQASRRKRIVAYVLLGTVLTALVVIGVAWAAIMRDIPDPGAKPKGTDQTTVIYDRNGEVLAKLFAEQNRTDTALADMPADLRNAIVSTEDQRFYEHSGVDPWGIARAVWVDVTEGKLHGGSTITQQYVKVAFVTPERTLKRKVMEAILAYRVEKELTKDQILERYLNTIYFGHGAYGVESAAQVYFGTTVSELDLAQCATLAGVVKSPGRYSPYLDPAAAKKRRDTVLGQMAEQGFIDAAAHDAAVAEEFALSGLADSSAQAPYFMEYIKAQLIDEYSSEAVFRGGMKVKTTLDLRMQRVAEQAITSILDQPGDPSAALVAIDPATGEIVTMVGGRDFSQQQFNVAVQGRRQPGSAFKPFVLVSALQHGVGTEQLFKSGARSFALPNGQTWKVSGSSDASKSARLREATEKSVNSVYAELILDTGAKTVVETARTMGITSDVEPVPAIALGGLKQGVSPLEMASAYGTLAAGGKRTVPYGLLEVADSSGEVLYSGESSATQALDPSVAFITTDILTGVLSRGTGTAARIGRPAAGKTGTTQEYRDAWFVGYTPELVCAVWVGYPDSQVEMKSVHGRAVTGGSFPAEIWARFMQGALGKTPAKEFVRPKGVSSAKICTDSGVAATEWCPTVITSVYLSKFPPESCPLHTGPTKIDIPSVIGMTKEAALAALKNLMLLFNVIEQDVPGVPAGIVAAQSPDAGSVGTTATVVTITVSNGGGTNLPPKASFITSPGEAIVGQDVTFDATASSDDGKITTYLWEFGDGEEGQGLKTTHVYADPGTYEITLWVTDDKNQTSSVTRKLIVK